MDSPKMTASIRIGMVGSMVPVGVKCSSPDRCPSWKIHTTTPKVADRDSTFITIAFTGSTTDPGAGRSGTPRARATTAGISGGRAADVGGPAGRRRALRPLPDTAPRLRRHRTRRIDLVHPRDRVLDPGQMQ